MNDGEKIEELHKAVQSGLYSTVRYLIAERGFPVNGADAQGRTAMHHAARAGNAGLIKLLFELGGALDAQDADGATPLFLVPPDRANALCELLVLGAKSGLQDEKGRTALHVHVQKDNAILVAALLTAKADKTVKDHEDKLPADYAHGNAQWLFKDWREEKRRAEAEHYRRLRGRMPGGMI